GEVTYHLQVADHSARFGVGPARPEDVRFVQDWDTAVAVATGRLNAQDAFMGGRIRLTGDQQKLLDSQDVFRALDAAFTAVRAVRAQTEYREPDGPEPPEVQAHAERRTEGYAGAPLARFQPITFTALKTAVPAPDGAYGHSLERVGRRGKYLLLEFAPLTFVV